MKREESTSYDMHYDIPVHTRKLPLSSSPFPPGELREHDITRNSADPSQLPQLYNLRTTGLEMHPTMYNPMPMMQQYPNERGLSGSTTSTPDQCLSIGHELRESPSSLSEISAGPESARMSDFYGNQIPPLNYRLDGPYFQQNQIQYQQYQDMSQHSRQQDSQNMDHGLLMQQQQQQYENHSPMPLPRSQPLPEAQQQVDAYHRQIQQQVQEQQQRSLDEQQRVLHEQQIEQQQQELQRQQELQQQQQLSQLPAHMEEPVAQEAWFEQVQYEQPIAVEDPHPTFPRFSENYMVPALINDDWMLKQDDFGLEMPSDRLNQPWT